MIPPRRTTSGELHPDAWDESHFGPDVVKRKPPSLSGGIPDNVRVALTFGLELVRHGALLVAADGVPRFANTAASAILQKRDGLFLAGTGLAASRASQTRLLHRLLDDVITAPHGGEPEDSPITIERELSRSALIVRVIPGPGLGCEDGAEHRTALGCVNTN